MAQWKQIQLGTMKLRVQPLASLSGLMIRHCCELWCRSQTPLGSDVAVAVWRRPAAIAPIGPLAWEPPYAVDVAPKSKKKKTKTKSAYWFHLTTVTSGRDQLGHHNLLHDNISGCYSCADYEVSS